MVHAKAYVGDIVFVTTDKITAGELPHPVKECGFDEMVHQTKLVEMRATILRS